MEREFISIMGKAYREHSSGFLLHLTVFRDRDAISDRIELKGKK